MANINAKRIALNTYLVEAHTMAKVAEHYARMGDEKMERMANRAFVAYLENARQAEQEILESMEA